MGGTWRRRAVTIPRVGIAFALVTLLFPLLSLAALLVDTARWLVRGQRFAALRVLCFGWVYLLGQLLGLLALSGAWLASRVGGARRAELLVEWTYAIQSAWARALFASVCCLFGLRVAIEGDPLLAPGPYLLLARHASIVDTLLPTVLVTARHGVRLRFVLKRELLADPCLDVAGLRLPNYFVDRDATDNERELAGVSALARGLGRDEGVLIYPEGTRFTPAKRARALERLALANPDLVEKASALTHLLPPRLGGTLALLEAAPDADVVFLAHVGLDGFASVADIFTKALSQRVIRVAVWRVAADRIPRARPERVDWLFAEWQRMNDWVREQLGDHEVAPALSTRAP